MAIIFTPVFAEFKYCVSNKVQIWLLKFFFQIYDDDDEAKIGHRIKQIWLNSSLITSLRYYVVIDNFSGLLNTQSNNQINANIKLM